MRIYALLIPLFVLLLTGCGARCKSCEEAPQAGKLDGYTADEIRLIVASSSKFAAGLRSGGEIQLESLGEEMALRDKLVSDGEIAVIYLTTQQLAEPWAEALYDKASTSTVPVQLPNKCRRDQRRCSEIACAG